MQLPEELQSALEKELSACSVEELRKAAAKITAHYHDGQNSGALFNQQAVRLAYLAVRMPATYAAIHRVLRECPFQPVSLLDIGAGPGTGGWAAMDCFPSLQSIVFLEQSQPMVELGKRLASAVSWEKKCEWRCQSLDGVLAGADCALLSYVIAELNRSQVEKLLERLWEQVKWVVILEPGTPAGHQRILQVREWALKKGAHLIAPCPHRERCPLQTPDWCHFPARVERTRLHKYLKGATLGYEDEKFSYLVFGKEAGVPHFGRIVGSPQKGSGFVRLPLCTEGAFKEVVVSKKREEYRAARDAEWGDPWK